VSESGVPWLTPPDAGPSAGELADWAGRAAIQHRSQGFHCSEAVLRAAAEALGIRLPDALLRSSTGFGGGGGNFGDRCGALNSGALLISYLYGRVDPTDDDMLVNRLVCELHRRFEGEMGSTQCAVLRKAVVQADAGGSCAPVFEAGARIVVQLLGEKDSLPEGLAGGVSRLV